MSLPLSTAHTHSAVPPTSPRLQASGSCTHTVSSGPLFLSQMGPAAGGVRRLHRTPLQRPLFLHEPPADGRVRALRASHLDFCATLTLAAQHRERRFVA